MVFGTERDRWSQFREEQFRLRGRKVLPPPSSFSFTPRGEETRSPIRGNYDDNKKGMGRKKGEKKKKIIIDDSKHRFLKRQRNEHSSGTDTNLFKFGNVQGHFRFDREERYRSI